MITSSWILLINNPRWPPLFFSKTLFLYRQKCTLSYHVTPNEKAGNFSNKLLQFIYRKTFDIFDLLPPLFESINFQNLLIRLFGDKNVYVRWIQIWCNFLIFTPFFNNNSKLAAKIHPSHCVQLRQHLAIFFGSNIIFKT